MSSSSSSLSPLPLSLSPQQVLSPPRNPVFASQVGGIPTAQSEQVIQNIQPLSTFQPQQLSTFQPLTTTQPQTTFQFQQQPTLQSAVPQSSLTVKRSFPNWDAGVVQKFANKHQYMQIVLKEKGGFRPTPLQISGAKRRLRDKQSKGIDFIYVPMLRLAGDRGVLTEYINQLVAMRKLNQAQAQQALGSVYDYNNSVANTNQRLEQELGAKAQAPKAAKEKGRISLDQLIDIHNVFKSGVSRSSQSGTGKTTAGRAKKTDTERIQEAIQYNTQASKTSGTAYKYLNFSLSKDGSGTVRSQVRGAGKKSFKVLALQWPLSSTNPALLKQKLDQFGPQMGQLVYNKGVQELQQQQQLSSF